MAQRTGCSLRLLPVRRIVLYFGGVNYYFVVAALQLSVLATGLIITRPVPRYTLTSPSPLTAEPTIDLVDISTVNCRLED